MVIIISRGESWRNGYVELEVVRYHHHLVLNVFVPKEMS